MSADPVRPGSPRVYEDTTTPSERADAVGVAANPGAIGAEAVSPINPLTVCGVCCTTLITLAAGVTLFAFAIIAFKGTYSNAIVGGVMVGCSGGMLVAAGPLIWISKHIVEKKKEKFKMEWEQLARATIILAAAIIGGSLGIAGIATGTQMGWIYFGTVLGVAGLGCLSSCCNSKFRAAVQNARAQITQTVTDALLEEAITAAEDQA